jgi:hypothetical protein
MKVRGLLRIGLLGQLLEYQKWGMYICKGVERVMPFVSLFPQQPFKGSL